MGKSGELFLEQRESEEVLKKQSLSDGLTQIKNAVLDGEIDALKAFIKFKQLSDQIEIIKAEIKDLAIAEQEKYGKVAEIEGYEITKTQSGRYDYNNIPEWTKLKDQLKEIEEAAKAACKADKATSELIDKETGEITEIKRAEYNPSATSIKIERKR